MALPVEENNVRFVYRVKLRGSNGKETTKTYDLGDFTTGTSGGDFDAALGAAGQVRTALEAVTDAVIAQESVTHYYGEDATVPAAADIFEEAVLSLGLVSTDGTTKTGISTIPAPVIGVFVGASGEARDIVDIADAGLATYVTQLEQHTFLSDGDAIDTTAGSGGLIKGHRRVKRGRTAR